MLSADYVRAEINRQIDKLFMKKSTTTQSITTATDKQFRHGTVCVTCEARVDVVLPNAVDEGNWADFEWSIANLFLAHRHHEHGDLDQL